MSLIFFCFDISMPAPLNPQILTAIWQRGDDAPGAASILSLQQKKKITLWTTPWQPQKSSREECHLLIKGCSRGLTEAFCTVQPCLWHIWVMRFTKGVLGSVPNQLPKNTLHTQASGEKLCCPSLYATLTLSGCIELFQCICFPQGSCLRDDWTCHINRLIIKEYVLLVRLAATT